ncbi:MAG: TonB-dependent receptor [Thiovulaceae bacterium]|nr:TonB-dependent receptor [Sulfurimonadaceae bacterium]
MKIFIILMLFISSVFAVETGELSFYAMKDGKPLANQTIVIFKKSSAALIVAPANYDKSAEIVTDSDGYLFTVLPVGTYQLQVVTKENGIPQAYVKKNFVIKKNKESQIIVSLKADNTLDFVDEEAPKAAESTVQIDDNATKANGFVSLQLTSSEDTKPIKNARIFVKGLKIDLKSDEKGYVTLTVPEGNQTISIIHSEYSSQTVKVEVLANESINKFVEMSPASMELEEFVVLAPQVQGSVAAVMAEERNSESIASIIGSEQMSKQGDSNAASALKRVAGVTILGGKYIYVRGLGDRYSSTELNGMSLPSPNPIKRTVPLDMFPSGVIGSLQVQKTFTPDITGAFGGGYVNVRTKKISDEDYAKIKVGMNVHDSYGKEAPSYQGSSRDWSGVDDGYRSFNSGLTGEMTPAVGENPPSLDYTEGEMQTFLKARDVNNHTTNVPLGGEVGIEVAKSFTIADEHELSFLASYGYKSQAKLQTYTSYDYITSRDGIQVSTPDNTAVNETYIETVKHGGLFNVGYQFRNFDIAYTKLYVLNTMNQTRAIEGTFGENNSEEKQSYLEWQERELDINQLNGGLSYEMLVDNRFDFGYELATASEYVPNDVTYDYKKVFADQPFQFQPRQSKLTYNNRTTEDEVKNFYLKNKTDIPLLSDEDYIEFGYVQENKERVGTRLELTMQSSIDNTAIISGPIGGIINYGNGDELDYSISSQPKDQYNASLDRNAFYLKSLIKPVEDLDLTFGMRHVDLKQSVEQYSVDNNLVVTTTNDLEFSKNLPSLGAKYTINEENQIRLAYSETFVYPDFREFVDAEFIHPVFLAKIAGNPDLIETDIQNVDFRYDYFFNKIDSISTSLFYKHMDNPIEDTQTFTTGTLPRYSFENSATADLAGIELSWYKNLDFISNAFDNLVFSGNYTYMTSKVELTPEQQQKFVTQDRGLQGLSPQVLNLSLTYEDSENRTLNLSYNKMSERLMRVALKNGTVIYALDDYEVPPHLVDFTWTEQFKTDAFADMAFTFKLKNILDGETIWKQGENVTLKYKTGRSISMSLSAKF